MLTNDLFKKHMFKFGVTCSYKMEKNHQKVSFMQMSNMQNELVCIFIQLYKQVCQAFLCETLTEFISKECMLQNLILFFFHTKKILTPLP